MIFEGHGRIFFISGAPFSKFWKKHVEWKIFFSPVNIFFHVLKGVKKKITPETFFLFVWYPVKNDETSAFLCICLLFGV